MKNVKQVDSLDKVVSNRVYTTKNYDLLKETQGNRAGISERRVKKFMKLIKDGKFLNEVSFVTINRKGYIIDGHHRAEALKRSDMPINFILTDNAKFNSRDKNKVLHTIALINSSINPMWSKDDHFKSAITSGIPLAIKLDKVKQELVEDFKLSPNNISTNDLYGVLKRDIKSYGTKVTRNELENPELMKELSSKDFKEDVKFYARLMQYLKHTPLRSYKTVKEIFRKMWSDENFDKKRFYENLIKEGYKVHNDTVEEHRREINRLANKKRRCRGRPMKIENMPELKTLQKEAEVA